MPPRVRFVLPRSLRMYWQHAAEAAEVDGATLAEAVAALGAASPGLGARIVDEQGRIRPHVLVFVNARMVSASDDPARVALADGDTLRIVPAVSGG